MLVCGTAPFQEANDSETLTMIMDCKYSFPSHISTISRIQRAILSLSKVEIMTKNVVTD